MFTMKISSSFTETHEKIKEDVTAFMTARYWPGLKCVVLWVARKNFLARLKFIPLKGVWIRRQYFRKVSFG